VISSLEKEIKTMKYEHSRYILKIQKEFNDQKQLLVDQIHKLRKNFQNHKKQQFKPSN
jgi:hypothetical protein